MNEYIIILVIIGTIFLSYILQRIYLIIRILFLRDEDSVNGYVYIIYNEAFKEDIYKIGMTERLDFNKRLKELFNTSVPFPFKTEYMIEHSNPKELEKMLHKYFDKYRLNKKREFFKINKKTLKIELKRLKLI